MADDRIATGADIEAAAFACANAWAAENGKISLYERSGGRSYDPEAEGSLQENMRILTAALLSKAQNRAFADVMRQEIGEHIRG